jgi:hypothetical protein
MKTVLPNPFADVGKKRPPRKRKTRGTKKSPRRKSKAARK